MYTVHMTKGINSLRYRYVSWRGLHERLPVNILTTQTLLLSCACCNIYIPDNTISLFTPIILRRIIAHFDGLQIVPTRLNFTYTHFIF